MMPYDIYPINIPQLWGVLFGVNLRCWGL